MDARLWAKAFVEIDPHAEVGGGISYTEEVMLTWFANAIMAGYDFAKREPASKDTSDGHHTFRELYRHRHALFLALLSQVTIDNDAWYSLKHADGSMFDDFFVAGMDVRTGYKTWEMVTYHLPLEYLPLVQAMANVECKQFAPPWDGHTPADVVDRLTRSAGHGAVAGQATEPAGIWEPA
jgi:hypothetical protein